jgi:hypothetical protein
MFVLAKSDAMSMSTYLLDYAATYARPLKLEETFRRRAWLLHLSHRTEETYWANLRVSRSRRWRREKSRSLGRGRRPGSGLRTGV